MGKVKETVFESEDRGKDSRTAGKSNGNREDPDDAKISDAQHGETDVNKAKEEQPPDART